MGVNDVFAVGQIFKMQQSGVEPLLVWVFGGQLRLNLVVLNDSTIDRVDEEHTTWLQSSLANNRCRVKFEDTGFGTKYDKAICGNPETTWPQTVAIEDSTDEIAICERDAGGPIPRLHERRVVLVERPASRVHRQVVFPCLRNHHQDRVRQRATTEVQQLEDFVKTRRVAAGGVQIGKSRSRSPGMRSLASMASRAVIQLRLPLTVLISPLCAM